MRLPSEENDPRLAPPGTVEVPEGDVVAQKTPVDPDEESDLEPVGEIWQEADPADVADQHRAVPFDDQGDEAR
ncbi:hypothetical protein SAMN05192558_101115 [Actinokineospora alba]|uniref:Uncharacterized protein n=1 Tax=Actinokineospora alba TaxID=504798 RepID=A0A1H0EV29_9PSEU|nr:hypothetical protein [Actinokineospora alba]TDP69236.1 hypothetical protein C8E96_4812 [Actinokineospora alba]SDI21262.1 hypothetical protein SAMN05421871_103754 [Actinokineospora alba]SDN86287.1 hypothetical protein SAMN05192558_101115 [Actinokineospora alba]